MKNSILGFMLAGLAFCYTQAIAAPFNRDHCIRFVSSTGDVGFATNSCPIDLDITWCHSSAPMHCTDRWKSDSVNSNDKTTVDYDRNDRSSPFKLMFACESGSSECLKARNAFRSERSR